MAAAVSYSVYYQPRYPVQLYGRTWVSEIRNNKKLIVPGEDQVEMEESRIQLYSCTAVPGPGYCFKL
eukprot:SAG11_NODE_4018_length_2104_cov_2.543142_1_plen_67_part_00